ncbi:hypothetical protein ACFLXP_02820 [Chloroflexota bacterium]
MKIRAKLIIMVSAVVLILVVVLVSLYINRAPYRATIITVDDTSIDMEYFLKRARLSGENPLEMIDILTEEMVIRIKALEYVNEPTEEDIDEKLRIIAAGDSGEISDSEFKEWYRQLLPELDISDSEYRETIATSIIAERFQEYLSDRIPAASEHVHLDAVILDNDEMNGLMDLWATGSTVEEAILETWEIKKAAGEVENLGWFPRGVLMSHFEKEIFSLDVGEITNALEPESQIGADEEEEDLIFYLFMLLEKEAERTVDEGYLQVLKEGILDVYVEEEMQFHDIRWYGLNNGFDDYTLKWIQLELAK